MKISDYLATDVLLMLDRDIRYLENKIKDSEDLFAARARAKDKELLAESLALRNKLVNLIIDSSDTWIVKEET